MSAAAVLGRGPGHDALLPRAPGGNGPGAALALLVHAGLVAALTVSVDWRTQAPEAVSAELWASVPQIAAPAAETPPTPAPEPTPAPAPAPAPAPPPPRAVPQPAEPDIATERAERRRAEERRKAELAAEREKERDRKQAAEREKERERERLAAERRRADDDKKQRDKAAADTREAKASEERLAQQREENLRRMMAQAGGGTGPATSTGTAAQNAAPSAAYSGRLVALIRGNLVFTGIPADNNAAEVEVTAAAGGTIISSKLVKSSGHKDWDDAVLRAIARTASLPRDADGRVPARLIISFRPRE